MKTLAFVMLLAAQVPAAVTFFVSAKSPGLAAHDGRVVVYVVGPDRPLERGEQPARWDYNHEPMPLYGRDVTQFGDGGRVTIDGSADAFQKKLADLPPGKYAAQAVFDWQREASGWWMEPGNVVSPVVNFELKDGSDYSVQLELSRAVKGEWRERRGAELVEIRSKLLSDFAGRDVVLRAGVALPIAFNPDERYGVIYEIPGFGGRHTDIGQVARHRERLASRPASDERTLASRTFHVYLDPESRNGHTLFADSDVNGPYGRALVEELIPAIEARFPSIVREPRARLLTGHSSGGYSACWLQTHYNDFFAGAWPSSPDPIDFRKFEQIDLYASDNLYTLGGTETSSVRDEAGKTTLHVRDENAWENTVQPDNAGGQQWQSWQAVFGVPRGDGYPKALYDIRTGVIDKSQLDQYRKFDLGLQLRDDPARFAPIWREKIRLLVGGADDYYLNEACELMKAELEKLPPTGTPATNHGYIKVVPGKTHDTIYDAPEMRAVDREMLDALGELGRPR